MFSRKGAKTLSYALCALAPLRENYTNFSGRLKEFTRRENVSDSSVEESLMKIDGGCHCGYITYTAEIDPKNVGICHCTDCQTLSGTAFRTSVPAAKDAFNLLTGKPKIYVKTAESGAKRAQAFCPECGTPIYAAAASHPESFNIRVGTARQRAELRPKSQGWCRSAYDWVMNLQSIKQFPKQRTS